MKKIIELKTTELTVGMTVFYIRSMEMYYFRGVITSITPWDDTVGLKGWAEIKVSGGIVVGDGEPHSQGKPEERKLTLSGYGDGLYRKESDALEVLLENMDDARRMHERRIVRAQNQELDAAFEAEQQENALAAEQETSYANSL